MSQPRSVPFDALSFVPRFAYGEMAQSAEVAGSADDTDLGVGKETEVCGLEDVSP